MTAVGWSGLETGAVRTVVQPRTMAIAAKAGSRFGRMTHSVSRPRARQRLRGIRAKPLPPPYVATMFTVPPFLLPEDGPYDVVVRSPVVTRCGRRARGHGSHASAHRSAHGRRGGSAAVRRPAVAQPRP